MNRRNMLQLAASGGLGVATTALTAQDQTEELDLVGKEAILVPFEDGLLVNYDDEEFAIPRMYADRSRMVGFNRLSASEGESEPSPLLPFPTLVKEGEDQSLAFVICLPDEDDKLLFEPAAEGEPLVIATSPSFLRQESTKKGDTKRFGNSSDGKIKKKYDVVVARFEAFGIIKKDLNPTCVSGLVEGIWLKVDLFGPLLGSINRWKNYAEGSLGKIVDQPGQYQFHWTKPSICSTGVTDRDAIYNGVLKMLQDLVKDIAGSIGRYIDDLLRLSPSIAAYISDNLVKWIGISNPGSTPGATPKPGTPMVTASFAITASPSIQTVRRGSSVSYSVQVNPENGFSGRVSLTAAGSTGSRVSFSPSSMTGGGRSNFTVSTSRSSKVGTHPIKLIATSGSVKKEVNVTITILS